MSGLDAALAAKLKAQLASMIALRDGNFDRAFNRSLVNFQVLEHLDPGTRQCPTKYRVEIHAVAVTGMAAKGKALKDFQNAPAAFVAAVQPRGLDWEPEITDGVSDPSAQPLAFKVFLQTDPLKAIAPEVFFEQRVWHPNIRWDNGQTCYGSKQEWVDPTRTLADLVRRVYTMVAFLGQGAVNNHPDDLLNREAGRWFTETQAKMPELFPLSNRYLA